MNHVLVTGASGQVGKATAQALLHAGVRVRAAVRSVDEALPAGAEAVRFDFADRSTWDAALAGVDGLFLLRPPAISDVRTTLNALVDRGAPTLRRVVFLSVAGAEKMPFIPHARVEAHLRAGAVPFTLLRAGFFAQNLCGPYRRDIAEDDRLIAPAGDATVSWTDTRDLGEAAARAFVAPDSDRDAWLLTGPEARSFAEVAALLTAALGRPIRYDRVSLPGFVAHLVRRRGLPLDAALVYAVLHTAVRLGAESRVDPTLARVLDRRPRTIADTIADHRELWLR